jgi:hypothetical protein
MLKTGGIKITKAPATIRVVPTKTPAAIREKLNNAMIPIKS